MAFHEYNEKLFYEGSLADALYEHVNKVEAKVNTIPQAQFLASSDDQVAEYIGAELSVEPLVLHTDKKTMEQEETEVDVRGYFNRAVFDDDEPALVRGSLLKISIPYTGQPELWRIRPNQFWMTRPFANVYAPEPDGVGHIEIVIDQPSDEPIERVQRLLDDTLRDIDQALKAQASEIERRNAELIPAARTAAAKRRAALQQNDSIAKALNIPLKHRSGVPEAPVQRTRKLERPLPQSATVSSTPDPAGIAATDYEHILSVIRHEGRTFEATPVTYKSLDEEDLRNILLAHLNGHYLGDATGETFRRSGKTDIRIEDQKRAAFVGECKVWRGPAELSAAVDQLVSYLTWRDSKAALIVFNKHNVQFSSVLQKVPEVLSSHSLFLQQMSTSEDGEWRYVFTCAGDPNVKLTVHVFAFNLYVPAAEPVV